MKTITLILSFTFFSFYSFSQDAWSEIDTTLFIDWDTFEIEPAFDVTGLMINVLKKNRWINYEESRELGVSIDIFTGMPSMTYGKVKRRILPAKHYAEKPYFGVSLGNSLFVNYSGELFFFVPELWGLNYKTGFEIKDFDDNKTTFLHSVKSQRYKIRASSKIKPMRELLTAKWDSTFNDVSIYFSRKLKNQLSIDGKNLKISNKKTIGEVKFDSLSNEFVLSKLYKKDDYDERKLTKKSAKELILKKNMKVSIEGKALKIGNTYRIFRTKNAIYIRQGEELTMRIKITHERVDVYEMGEFQTSFYKL